MKSVLIAIFTLFLAMPALAIDLPGGLDNAVVKKVNAKLLSEGRKNQCTFKTDSDVLARGCDAKVKRLGAAVLKAKRMLTATGLSGFHFVVTGHTDSSGDPNHNQDLSERRALAIVKQLRAKGVPDGEIEAVGKGSASPLVSPDNTRTKKAKNRRYDIQVKL